MKRGFLHFCCGLLIWAVFDDIVAAQTPELDDDIAAAADNDCLQWTPVSWQFRDDAQSDFVSRACSHGLATDRASVRTLCSPGASYCFLNSLYLFLSLQR
jgi:hypothetical protein